MKLVLGSALPKSILSLSVFLLPFMIGLTSCNPDILDLRSSNNEGRTDGFSLNTNPVPQLDFNNGPYLNLVQGSCSLIVDQNNLVLTDARSEDNPSVVIYSVIEGPIENFSVIGTADRVRLTASGSGIGSATNELRDGWDSTNPDTLLLFEHKFQKNSGVNQEGWEHIGYEDIHVKFSEKCELKLFYKAVARGDYKEYIDQIFKQPMEFDIASRCSEM